MKHIGAGQSSQLYSDEVHPSIEGYALMGEVAVKAFQDVAYSSKVL